MKPHARFLCMGFHFATAPFSFFRYDYLKYPKMYFISASKNYSRFYGENNCFVKNGLPETAEIRRHFLLAKIRHTAFSLILLSQQQDKRQQVLTAKIVNKFHAPKSKNLDSTIQRKYGGDL